MIGVTHLFSAYLHRVTFWTGHISLCPLSFSVERAHCVPLLPCRILGTEPGTACRSPGAPSMAGPRPWSLLQVSAAGIYYHQPLYLFQAPPSLGFSRQEDWSGLPFPSPMHESEKWKGSRSVVSKGCCNSITNSVKLGFKQQTLIPPQFRRLETWNQDVNTVGSFWSLREDLFQALLPAFDGCTQSLTSLGLWLRPHLSLPPPSHGIGSVCLFALIIRTAVMLC